MKKTLEKGFEKFVIKNPQKLNNKQIAKLYMVAPSTIGCIKRNLSWKDGVNN